LRKVSAPLADPVADEGAVEPAEAGAPLDDREGFALFSDTEPLMIS
jgi:hypothetical protein